MDGMEGEVRRNESVTRSEPCIGCCASAVDQLGLDYFTNQMMYYLLLPDPGSQRTFMLKCISK